MPDHYMVPPAVRRRIAERAATGPHGTAAPVERDDGSQRHAAFDPAIATRAGLVAEAALRGITVTRGDGKDGDPLVEDYRAALAETP